MRTQTIRTVTGTVIHSCLWALILFAPAAAAAANDKATAGDSGAVLDFHATVSAVREVPAGNPMPGLHLQAKVKGRMMDIYIAPLDFVAQCGVKVSRGDEVHIVGSPVFLP